MSKMVSHEPFGHLQHKLWSKKGCKSNWQFNSRSLKVGEVRHAVGKLLTKATTLVQTSFRSQFGARVMSVSGLHFGNPGKKNHLDAGATESCRKYYMGEGGGFPRIQAVQNQVSPSAHGLSQHPKVFPNVN
jgi:hypothetical protein